MSKKSKKERKAENELRVKAENSLIALIKENHEFYLSELITKEFIEKYKYLDKKGLIKFGSIVLNYIQHSLRIYSPEWIEIKDQLTPRRKSNYYYNMLGREICKFVTSKSFLALYETNEALKNNCDIIINELTNKCSYPYYEKDFQNKIIEMFPSTFEKIERQQKKKSFIQKLIPAH
ncbi:MAG: hypothetical protein N4A44_03750 [Alphaproteobacteria bacterium]|jgi:hypothetical protein|nr:hypothetical protein [Alphaproteobacteria bacterium]